MSTSPSIEGEKCADVFESHRFKGAYKVYEKKWTPEDDTLLATVSINLKLDWKKVTKKMAQLTGKKTSPKFLRQRYNTIKPQYSNKNVSLNINSDIKIYELFEEIGDDWISMSKLMGNMDPIKIRNRYYSHVFKKEDEIVAEIKAR